ncbi:hypothetical protein FBY35_5863 [Streptomyces sp. SLBN-118]|nr:hypothetical protein FBY35_5863 [Streptomyces sp. SLBN-118]
MAFGSSAVAHCTGAAGPFRVGSFGAPISAWAGMGACGKVSR